MVSGIPKSLNMPFKASRTNFVLSPDNCLITGKHENKSTTRMYVLSLKMNRSVAVVFQATMGMSIGM